jgi:hypothetical protein
MSDEQLIPIGLNFRAYASYFIKICGDAKKDICSSDKVNIWLLFLL